MYGMWRIPRDRVVHKRNQAALLCVILSLCVGLLLGLTSERAFGGDVSVSVRVRPSVSATFTASGVVVRANTPWQMTTTSEDGSTLTYYGGPTVSGGESIELVDGSTLLSLVAAGSN